MVTCMRAVVVGLLAIVATTDCVLAVEFRGMSYVDNGTIRVGMNLDIGGAITYVAPSDAHENIINSHDWGRQIQLSFYSGPTPFVPNGKEPSPTWRFLGWNPIQAGDCYGHGSKVIAHENDGQTMYVKCIPMQWPLNNEPGECTFETWTRLEGSAVWVRSRINNARADTTQYPARSGTAGRIHERELPPSFHLRGPCALHGRGTAADHQGMAERLAGSGRGWTVGSMVWHGELGRLGARRRLRSGGLVAGDLYVHRRLRGRAGQGRPAGLAHRLHRADSIRDTRPQHPIHVRVCADRGPVECHPRLRADTPPEAHSARLYV